MRKLCTPLLALLALAHGPTIQPSEAADVAAAIKELLSVSHKERPTTAQDAWRELASADATQLTTILAGMKGASPLAENWLRSACDAVVERQLQAGNKLPVDDLRAFVLDPTQSPRARRSAYEWLTQVAPDTPVHLLPKLLDDPSLELRYDAVEHLLTQVAGEADEQKKGDVLEQALGASRNFAQIQKIAGQLETLGRPVDLTRHFGFVTAWHYLGPFDIADGKGFSEVYPPEEGVDLSAKYAGSDGEVAWTEAAADGELGQLDFCKVFGKNATGVMYALAQFNSPTDQNLQVRYEASNATKLWVNGNLVAENEIYHSGFDQDQYRVPVHFQKGANSVLIKVCQTKRAEEWALIWSFRLRICDELGGAIHQTSDD